MSDRRHFLKQLALLGAVTTTATPISFALGQNESSQLPATEPPDGTFAVSYGQIRRPAAPPRTITIPDAGEYKVLKGDFHMHTLFSDGSVMPKDRVTEAIDNGLDVISITDHLESQNKELTNGADRNRSYELAKAEADKSNLILVRAGEIATSEWHFNTLFLQDANPIAAVAREEWQKRLAISVEQGGFNHWNHPNWIDGTPDKAPFGLKRGEPMRFFDEIEEVRAKGHLHGIEVFNGTTYYPIALDWCNERDLAPISNTDIHGTDWGIYGHQNPLRPMTLIFAKDRNHDFIREAFFAKRLAGFAAGIVFGAQQWLEKLFVGCVTMTKKPGLLELVNKSDIPCFVQAGGAVRELPVQGRLSMYRSGNVKKLTVNNWLVGMNQPLEIDLG